MVTDTTQVWPVLIRLGCFARTTKSTLVGVAGVAAWSPWSVFGATSPMFLQPLLLRREESKKLLPSLGSDFSVTPHGGTRSTGETKSWTQPVAMGLTPKSRIVSEMGEVGSVPLGREFARSVEQAVVLVQRSIAP